VGPTASSDALGTSRAVRSVDAAPTDGAAFLPSQIRRIARSEAGAIVGGWTAVAALFAGHSYLSYAADGRPVTALQAVWWSVAEWYTWALLTPVVVWIVRRVRRSECPRARALGTLVAFGLLVALLQVVLEYGADRAAVLLSGDRDLSVRVWLAGGVRGAVLDLAYLLPRKIGFSVVTFWAVVGVVFAADNYRLYRDRELRAARLEGALVGAQLQALQAQLQPHFLFNTLNAIASLIPESPEVAEEMVESLADLLRAALRDGRQREIPLEREMELLDQYLRIQELRFQDRLRVRRALPPELADALVPPLLLQPLVENAIRHGVAPRPGGGAVSVSVEGSGGQLVIVVEDDGPGFTGAARDGAGLGLANVRARLERLYGDSSALVASNRPGGGASVTLRLPLRPPAARGRAGTVATDARIA
jgi:two-component system, LytTR family, sensor kinase